MPWKSWTASKQMLPNLQAQLPPSVQMSTLFDRSLTIRNSVDDVKFTLVLALFLVILVIFLFLRNLSATVIPSLALPFSLVGTFAVMVPLRIFDRQPFTDGTDARGRLRRG